MSGFAFERFPEFEEHEEVHFFKDPRSGLRAVISLHSTVLGPATGGTRVHPYSSGEDAVRDALRLSRAMTYKCALADVPFGGGKGVLILPSGVRNRARIFEAYAHKVSSLGGRFTTGEDMGVTARDLAVMQRVSPFVNGRRSGDLGPWAALGVFGAATAALREAFGAEGWQGRRIAIKGLGKVGSELARLTASAGAEVIGSDTDSSAIRRARRAVPGMRIVSPRLIHRIEADVFSPCAWHHDLDKVRIPELGARIICGGANNQLAEPGAALRIHRRGILYVPDYLANAGGLINAVSERMPGGYRETWVRRKVDSIGQTVTEILRRAWRENLPPAVIADRIAVERIRRKVRHLV